MNKTEKKHWQNGYQVRGGWHKTLALSLWNYAIMIAWGSKMEQVEIIFYKLI